MAGRLWRAGEPTGTIRAVIERGGLLAVPTESSYGLGVNPENEQAVATVYRVKGRGGDKPLPVVAANLRQLRDLGVDLEAPLVRRLAELWPAALSIVAPLTRPLPAAAGGSTLAVRVPANQGLRRLLDELGTPLTATSANRSGDRPALTASAAAELLTDEDAMVIDGGELGGGLPSTLVEIRDGRVRVLRQGAFSEAVLRRATEETRP